jgi:hypothetical protein
MRKELQARDNGFVHADYHEVQRYIVVRYSVVHCSANAND